MMRYLSFFMIPLAAVGLIGCASTEGPEDEQEMEGMVEAPRRAAWPSYAAPEVSRGKLGGIDFEDSSWEIPPGERMKIKAVATYLKVNAERVIVAGGAEVAGAEYARQLGQERALTVKAALIKAGIPANKIMTMSYGGDLPGKGGNRVEFGTLPTGEKAL